MLEAYKRFFVNYVKFDGRCSRAEFWWAFLLNFIIMIAFLVICLFQVGNAIWNQTYYTDYDVASIFFSGLFGFLYAIYGLATLIPSISITVRRLHDSAKSGWLALIWFVPYVGWLIILILCMLEGTKGENQYGDPSDYGNAQSTKE